MTNDERDIWRTELRRVEDVLKLRMTRLEQQAQGSTLEQLLSRGVMASLTSTLTRTAERVAAELTEDLLREPAFRDQMRTLVAKAFERALRDLGKGPLTAPEAARDAPESESLLTRLQRLEAMLIEHRDGLRDMRTNPPEPPA